MSRLEEALRRARQEPTLPRSPSRLDEALGQFPASGESATPEPAPVDNAPTPSAGEARVEAFSTPDVEEPRTPDLDSLKPDAFPRARRPALATTRINRTLTGRLVIGEEVKPVTIEQYRRLAAALHHAQADTGIKIVMVASALAGEGKTLTAVNLALTLSESYGRKVLLIDADLRRPTIHQVFQLPNVSGLSDGLKAEAERRLTVAEITPNLSVLPSGRPDSDPMSGLTSGRMSHILEEAAGKFDWVIVDTPPVGLITDAHLLAAMVHAAVLVVRAGSTPCALIQKAVESLDRNRIIGVVLNRVEDRALSPAGKYERYYRSYYMQSPDAGAVSKDSR